MRRATRSGLNNIHESRFCVHWPGVRGARRVQCRWSLPRRATKQTGQWRETQSGSAFAGGLHCRSSLEWNNHKTLLASRSPSRKGRFATMDIVETASTISLLLLAFCTACSPGGPSLTATDIEAVAPLPGRTFAAAYLTLHNQGPDQLTVSRVSSTHFARVEIHESQVVDDVIRMRRLDSITIDAGESVRFESGGKHLMLIDPKAGLDVGDSITLQFEYDNEGMLIVNAPLLKRK